MTRILVTTRHLREKGVEVLSRGSAISPSVSLPKDTVIEAPSSLKWTEYHHSLRLGAFSYHVSGYAFAADIGRYCSFGENVQIGRQNHPMSWASTSPVFYQKDRIFDVGQSFKGAPGYHGYAMRPSKPPTTVAQTKIGHDVWIGHGAFIAAGVNIGQGAIVAGHATVSKDVPPYAIVAGNPAQVKRFRFPQHLIDAMIDCRWWQFAPWQLQHLDPSTPRNIIDGVAELRQDEPLFGPTTIDLRDGAL